MKKILSTVALFALGLSVNAQIDLGVKAGVIFPANGDISSIGSQVQSIYETKGDSKTGYQAGLFLRINMPVFNLFVQPELLYTSIEESFYTGSTEKESLIENKIAKVDVPLLVGFSFLKIVNVKAGPILSYNLKNDLKSEASKVSNIEKKDFGMGLQLGAGITFKKLELDLRYERSLSSNEITFVQGNTIANQFSIDNRPSSIIASVAYKF